MLSVVVVVYVTVVDNQVDKTHAPVGLAVPPPGLGDDEAPGDVSLSAALLVLGHRDQRGLGVAEEEVSAPPESWEPGAVETQKIRHPHSLLPSTLAEIIRNIGLYLEQSCQLDVSKKTFSCLTSVA